MKKFRFVFFFSFLLVFSSQVAAQLTGNYKEGLKFINKEDLKKNITYLASDKMKGRAAGSEENLEAAKFIAKKFFDYGLTPYNEIANPPLKGRKSATDISKQFTAEKYFQRFHFINSKLNTEKTSLSFTKNHSSVSYSYDFKKDFVVDYGTNKNFLVTAPIVFVGYGIEKGEKGYSDFVDNSGNPIDVKNKIALIVESYPLETDTSSLFFKSRMNDMKSTKKKAANLKEKGALAVLVAQSPIKKQAPFTVKLEALAKAFTRTDFILPELNKEESLPIVYISKDVLNDIFNSQGKSTIEIFKNIDSDLNPQSFNIVDAEINLNISFDNKLVETQNVIGILEGTDPVLKNEYVVVGGHYDHVGLGYYGAMDTKNAGQIHNGADDNASGTCGVIEVAEAFSKVKSKRTIVFIGFSAEENGMLGSRHYAYQNPLFPHEKTAGMVNLDMISRNNKKILWVGGVFYSSDMKTLAEEANKEIGFELLYNVGLFTFASDQGPFIRRNVPSIFLFAGDHDDYHTPADDANKVDFEKAERVSKLGYLCAWLLANDNTKPSYRALTMEEKTQLVKDSLERQKKYKDAKEISDEKPINKEQ